jgi:hypothetical protein
MGRKKGVANRLIPLILGLLLAGVTVWLVTGHFSGERRAKEAVQRFYAYEQQGAFAESWELFHGQMKNKFAKGPYIQDRAHVFMNHFGVETFTFSIGEADKLDSWTMEKGAKPLKEVYKMTVTQTYKSKYGNFDLRQDVFAAKEKDEWKIMWNYQKNP